MMTFHVYSNIYLQTDKFFAGKIDIHGCWGSYCCKGVLLTVAENSFKIKF